MSSPQQPAVPRTARTTHGVPQAPSVMPIAKYSAFPPIPTDDRTWPTVRIDRAPLLVQRRPPGRQPGADRPDGRRRASCACSSCSCAMGFKEIEVGFPSASQPDFDFVRQLVEEDLIPDDVTIQVLTQARDELIERTFESHAAAPSARSSTSTTPRRPCSAAWCSAWTGTASPHIAVRGRRAVPEARPRPCPGPTCRFEYSPESLHRHRARLRRRGLQRGQRRLEADPGPARVIVNLPATVEMATPEHLRRQDRVDAPQPRLPRLGGACRCTRTTTGVRRWPRPSSATWPAPTASRARCSATASAPATSDLVTLALNLFSQGIDPEIDFSDIDEVRRTVEYCNQLPVHRAASLWRRPRLHRLLGLPPGRHQEGLRAPRGRRRAAGKTVDEIRGRCRTCRSTPRTSGAPTRR